LPDCAARVIRSHLDYLLTQAVEAKASVPPPVLPPDADEVETFTQFMLIDTTPNPLKALLESESNFTEIEKFAEAHPQKLFGIDVLVQLLDLIQLAFL